VVYRLSKAEFEYWSNLGVIVADRGLILKDKIIPATFQSKYEWEITLRDEKNNYWMQNLKNNRDFFDFKLLMRFSKFYGNVSFKIERGESISWYIVKSKFSNFFFGLKYKIKKILFYLRVIGSM
jgi:hypothetical protein